MLLILLFGGVFISIIAFARGYRLDINKKGLSSTGIIAVTSNPKASKVYINGELKGVTDTTFVYPPGSYTVEVKKDGYGDWKKTFVLKGELVVSADATLFPLNASLVPLTNLGIIKIVSVDRTERSLLFSQNGSLEKDGVYLFDSSGKPFSFFAPLKLLLLKQNLPEDVDFSTVQTTFSPDYKEAILEFTRTEGFTSAYLISLDEENKQLFDVTNSRDSLKSAWKAENDLEEAKMMEIFPVDVRKIASDSFQIASYSLDKTKILYRAKRTGELPFFIVPRLIATNQESEDRNLREGQYYVYDKKEDKNFKVKGIDEIVETGENIEKTILWHPNSRHLIINDGKHLSVMEYDNTNRQVVYSGPFLSDYVDISSDGRILILANFNPQTNKYPDVYAVGIK